MELIGTVTNDEIEKGAEVGGGGGQGSDGCEQLRRRR